jgi:hypothetical protein
MPEAPEPLERGGQPLRFAIFRDLASPHPMLGGHSVWLWQSPRKLFVCGCGGGLLKLIESRAQLPFKRSRLVRYRLTIKTSPLLDRDAM